MLPTDVHTSLKPAEAEALQELARGQVVLECGAWLGYSTIVLAQTAVEVHSVDWHHGDEQSGFLDTLPGYLSNLERYGVDRHVVTHVGRFEQVLPKLNARTFDGCFLDGKHDRESVDRDFRMLHRLMRRPAWIAVHDHGLFDVQPAVEAFLGWSGYRLETVVATLAVLRRGRHPARHAAAFVLPTPVKRALKRALPVLN